MIDPFTALAAISAAVKLVKTAAKTVDDVTSLGPVLGKYFDAKAKAIEVVEKSKQGGFKGSAMGQALELEMAIENAREFEESVKMLFFQANKMDVWQRIVLRARQMEGEAARAEGARKLAARRRKAEREDFWLMVFAGGTTAVLGIIVIWAVIFFLSNKY